VAPKARWVDGACGPRAPVEVRLPTLRDAGMGGWLIRMGHGCSGVACSQPARGVRELGAGGG